MIKAKVKIIELVNSILEWWEEHQYDTTQGGEEYAEEYNVYDTEPDFVTLAKRMKKEMIKDGQVQM